MSELRFVLDDDHHFKAADLKLERILRLLLELNTMNVATQASLDNLLAKVAKIQSVQQSEQTLLNGLSAMIAALKENQTDPKVLEVIDQATAMIDKVASDGAAAVTANTQA